jgi:LCP family protein required for cell wall assembly
VTGSDLRTSDNCGITDKQYAGAFGGPTGSQRSDTIMVLRFDPASNFAAVLSFPRDLFVKIAGRGRTDKINSAFDPDHPEILIKTITDNFKIPIDHYASIGFCGFKDLVDAVGNVKIPFTSYVRDTYTGFTAAPGCATLNGTQTLAYARSRHLQASPNGKRGWLEDGASDWSRIRRQQDLIKRIGQRLVNRGVATNPGMLNSLVKAAVKTITVQDGISIDDLLKLATRLRKLDPHTMKSYTFKGQGSVTSDGTSIVLPLPNDPNNKNVVKIFRGEALPADLAQTQTADQVIAEQASTTTVPPQDLAAPATSVTTTTATVPVTIAAPTTKAKAGAKKAKTTTTQPTTTTSAPSTATAATAPTATLFPPLPTVDASEQISQNSDSFVPPNDPNCV